MEYEGVVVMITMTITISRGGGSLPHRNSLTVLSPSYHRPLLLVGKEVLHVRGYGGGEG